jgi:GNAT superfamily N-acetyltransferase
VLSRLAGVSIKSALAAAMDLERDWAPRAGFGVRTAGPGEHDAICRVLVAAYQEHQWRMSAAAYMVCMTELIDLEARLAASQLLIAVRGGEAVGTISVTRDGAGRAGMWPASWARLLGLAVRPEERRRGVGTALLEEAVARARMQGAAALGVHVTPFMTGAVELYQRFGFSQAPAFDFDAARHDGVELGPRLSQLAFVLPLQ